MLGSNCTVSETDCPGFKVAGKVTPEIEKPAPDSVAACIVRAAVPVEVIVTDCVLGTFTTTLPNAKVEVLMPNADVAAFGCNVKLFDMPTALAVSVTGWFGTTAATLAEN